MPEMMRHRVIEAILEVGLVTVFHNGDARVAKEVVRACLDGGARIVEFTNRGDRAYLTFNELAELRDAELPELILGAGTVSDAETASLYINGGADFIVGPVFNPEVARLCNRRKVLYIPGCLTPTEISEAEEMGADIVKLFPASVATPGFVKAVLGPSPQTRIMASGGIKMDQGMMTEWIRAGAVALNLGSDLIRKELVARGDYGEITRNVEQCIQWIREARVD